MKRTKVLEAIANQLDFLNGRFQGVRTSFTKKELAAADVILTTIECMGMIPSCKRNDGEHVHEQRINNKCDAYIATCEFEWEPEDNG